LLVITLLVIGCSFASAQSFGFASTGGALYCNFEQLVAYSGGLYAGSDNLSACGDSTNATVSGFTASVKNLGGPASGPGVVYGDTLYATLYGATTDQWTVFSKLKCNKQNKFGQYTGKDGWAGVAGFSGFLGGTNAGPLSCSIPGKNGNHASKGVSASQKKTK
jgi:hypothetical protein